MTDAIPAGPLVMDYLYQRLASNRRETQAIIQVLTQENERKAEEIERKIEENQEEAEAMERKSTLHLPVGNRGFQER